MDSSHFGCIFLRRYSAYPARWSPSYVVHCVKCIATFVVLLLCFWRLCRCMKTTTTWHMFWALLINLQTNAPSWLQDIWMTSNFSGFLVLQTRTKRTMYAFCDAPTQSVRVSSICRLVTQLSKHNSQRGVARSSMTYRNAHSVRPTKLYYSNMERC